MTRWLLAWIRLAEGIVGVLTLGYARPCWELEFILWDMERSGRRK